MRSIRGFVVLASAAALALPAAAATPSKATQVPRHEIAAFRAKVKRLEAANKRLAAKNKSLIEANKTISQRWHEALRREDALKRHLAAVDPCPITHANGVPPGPTFGAEFYGNGALWVRSRLTAHAASSQGRQCSRYIVTRPKRPRRRR
jgi:hypothetical protein